MIKGLFETHIKVSSLEQSMHFYGDILELELGTVDSERRIAFYWLGKRGEAMLGLWETNDKNIPQQHFAFRCEVEDVLMHAAKYLEARNLPAYNFLNNGAKEPMVFAWMPAIAIYFNDPDNHNLEFIAMLPGDPRPALGIITYAEWQLQLSC